MGGRLRERQRKREREGDKGGNIYRKGMGLNDLNALQLHAPQTVGQRPKQNLLRVCGDILSLVSATFCSLHSLIFALTLVGSMVQML
jgi:hypothetical protein